MCNAIGIDIVLGSRLKDTSRQNQLFLDGLKLRYSKTESVPLAKLRAIASKCVEYK